MTVNKPLSQHTAAQLVVALRYALYALEADNAHPQTIAIAHEALRVVPFDLHLIANDLETLDMEAV